MIVTVLCLVLVSSIQGFLLDREVCYGDLGCFKTETVRSFSRPIVLLPDEPDKIGTRFFLYTRQNQLKSDEHELSRKVVDSFSTSNFNSKVPTKFIIHGFTHSAHEPWVQSMKDELLKHDDMNVIAVDWRQGAGFPYTQATANIRVVAMEAVRLIEFMQTEYPTVKAGDIHFIGHSLGAHASGEVGTKIKGIGRISGLDPAEPYFEGAVEDIRLERRDAEFVDIIHSDGSAFLGSLGMGYRSSVGHVDFYPNGGGDQPGCDKSVGSKLINSASAGLSKGTDALKDTFACSHQRAYEYYIESINFECPFRAYPCKSYDDFKAAKCLSCGDGQCSRMGYHADQSEARGDFYVMTNQKGEAPHCSYHYSMKVQAGVMDGKAYGEVDISVGGDNGTSFGPIPMTAKETYVETNTVLTRLVVTLKKLTDLSKVTVTYKKDDCFTCFVYTDFLRLQKVEINSGEDQESTAYCGKNTSVAKDQVREFSKAERFNSC